MNTDIRLLISFKGHRKRKKLEMILGPGATGCLIDLWLTVAQDSPEGILHEWGEDDIEIAAGWNGAPNEFVAALIKTKFLDLGKDGNYIIHDWSEHQSWATGAKARSAAAKKAAAARWNQRYDNSNKS